MRHLKRASQGEDGRAVVVWCWAVGGWWCVGWGGGGEGAKNQVYSRETDYANKENKRTNLEAPKTKQETTPFSGSDQSVVKKCRLSKNRKGRHNPQAPENLARKPHGNILPTRKWPPRTMPSGRIQILGRIPRRLWHRGKTGAIMRVVGGIGGTTASGYIPI